MALRTHRIAAALAASALAWAGAPAGYGQSFSPPTDVNLGIGVAPNRITGVEGGDLDGDGFGDLVATDNDNPGRIGYALGAAGGSYATQVPLLTSSSTGAYHPTLGDFDRDGLLDVVVAGENGVTAGHQAVYVSLGDMVAGAFVLGVPFGPFDLGPGSSVSDLAVTDIDRDGFEDVLATVKVNTGDQLAVLRGQMPPSPSIPFDFAPLTTSSTGVGAEAVDVCVDFDADGDKDVVVGGSLGSVGQVRIFPGTPSGALGSPFAVSLPPGTLPRDVHWIDCDQDDRYDIAVAGGGPTPRVVVLKNIGPPTYFSASAVAANVPQVGEAASLVRFEADFDGSEDLSVFKFVVGGVAGFETYNVAGCTLTSAGSVLTGTFAAGAVSPSVAQVHTVSDQNLDGREDIVVVDHSTSPSRVRVYRNTTPTSLTISPVRPRYGQTTPFTFAIDVPPALGGRPFVLLLSQHGTLPGLSLPGGVQLLLNPSFNPISISGTLPASGELTIVTPPVSMPAVPTAFSAQVAAAVVVQGASPGTFGFATNPAVITLP